MLFGLFRKKKKTESDSTEEKFNAIVALVKDLSRADYNRLRDAMDLAYNGYQKIRNVKTADERETEPVSEPERKLKFEEVPAG